MIINVHGQFPMAMLNCQRVGVSMFSYVLPHQESQHWRVKPVKPVKPDPSPVFHGFHGHCWNKKFSRTHQDGTGISTSQQADLMWSTPDSLLPHGGLGSSWIIAGIVAPGQLELLDPPELRERNPQSWATNVWQIQWLIQEIKHVDGHF